MPTLRALECLLAVADAGSVTEAATALRTSQPAVSHQLASLEREIGAALFERLPRGVRLTIVGRAVEHDARTAVTAAHRVVREGRSVAAGRGGRLRIGCAQSLTTTLVTPVLRGWRKRHPEVRLGLTESASADELVTQLDTGTLDLAVCPRPTRWDGHTALVGVEQVVVAMAADDPLAAGAAVTLDQLDGRSAVHYDLGSGFGDWLGARLAEAGVRLDVVLRTGQVGSAAQLAAAGLGIALVPASAVGTSFPGVTRRLEPALRREIVVLLANPSDRLAAHFATSLVRHGIRTSVLDDDLPEGRGDVKQ